MTETLISYFIVGLSMSLVGGVFLHENRIDRAATAAFSSPNSGAAASTSDTGQKHLSGDPHTHVERVSVRDAMRHHHGKVPQVMPPRHHEGKKDWQKKLFGRHFDQTYLPLIS